MGPLFDGTPEPAPPADRFPDFWALYPRKAGKATARKAWARAVTRAAAEVILAGLARYVDETAGADTAFIAHPATWLNNDRWADEPGANRRQARAGPQASRLATAAEHGPSGVVPKDKL